MFYLTDPLQLWHSEQQFSKLGAHVWVVRHGVLLEGVNNLLLAVTDLLCVLQTGRIWDNKNDA